MLNSNEVRLAPEGRVYVGNVGAVAPTDVEEAFSAEWHDLGYVNEDGVTLTPNIETTDFQMWQSLPPVKTSVTGLSLEINFVMGQLNSETTALFFFGAEWEEAEAGLFRLNVDSDQRLAERSLAVEWNDDEGSKNRFIVPRGAVTDREQLQLQRSALTTLGITYRALDNSGEFFYLLSDNASYAPESPSSP